MKRRNRLGWWFCVLSVRMNGKRKKTGSGGRRGGMIEYRKGYINQRLRLPAPSSRKGTGLSDGVIQNKITSMEPASPGRGVGDKSVDKKVGHGQREGGEAGLPLVNCDRTIYLELTDCKHFFLSCRFFTGAHLICQEPDQFRAADVFFDGPFKGASNHHAVGETGDVPDVIGG